MPHFRLRVTAQKMLRVCKRAAWMRPYRAFLAVRTALSNAIYAKRINPSKTVYDESYSSESQFLNMYATLIPEEEIVRFLSAKGVTCEAFTLTKAAQTHPDMIGIPFTSKKLIAANKAWTAVTSNPALLVGKSPKQALQKWLVEHAAELGLLTREGKPNQTGIDEICKVANWKPEGGATPTQSSSEPQSMVPIPRSRPAAPKDFGQKEQFDLDDEIPF